MQFALINCRRHYFSIFKKKCIPIQRAYPSLKDLYYELYTFELSLEELQLKKMPKKLQDFNRQFRKLYHVPMSLTHTYQYYCRKVDELIFGTEQIQSEVTPDQILNLTKKMVDNDLHIYHSQLIPKLSENLSLGDQLTTRFTNIEERLSRMLFKGYQGFSQASSRVSLFEQREYKGDFKFVLVDDFLLIQKLTECLYHASLFNKLRSKLTLAVEQAVTLHWQRLSPTALTINARPLKIIQDHFLLICQKLKEHPFQLLFYMIVNGIEEAIWLNEILKDLILEPRNSMQQFICIVIKKWLADRVNAKIQVVEREEFKMGKNKPTGQIFFQEFLRRYNYEFQSRQSQLFYHSIYQIQQKQFICLDHLLVKEEDLTLNGLGLMLRQFLLAKDQTLKHINWPRMLPMERRGQRDQYIFSKFKGMEKPKKLKVRYYD